jgi:hypothetical protein
VRCLRSARVSIYSIFASSIRMGRRFLTTKWMTYRNGKPVCLGCNKHVSNRADTCPLDEHKQYIAHQRAINRVWSAQADKKVAEFLAEKTCVCCSRKGCTFDHITPSLSGARYAPDHPHAPRDKYKKYLNAPHSFQFLCFKCNSSKGGGTTCFLHKRYLGVWNHLPILYDLDCEDVSGLPK